jgi:hypothetical protein
MGVPGIRDQVSEIRDQVSGIKMERKLVPDADPLLDA